MVFNIEPNQHIRMISEDSCDTEEEFFLLNYILKHYIYFNFYLT